MRGAWRDSSSDLHTTRCENIIHGMQERESLNFESLRPPDSDLADLGGCAEHYAHAAPESALIKLRSFAEQIVADSLVLDKLHALRKLGNRAARSPWRRVCGP